MNCQILNKKTEISMSASLFDETKKTSKIQSNKLLVSQGSLAPIKPNPPRES